MIPSPFSCLLVSHNILGYFLSNCGQLIRRNAGVRIEDNILITKDGYDNLTTAIKDVEEMQRIINSSA